MNGTWRAHPAVAAGAAVILTLVTLALFLAARWIAHEYVAYFHAVVWPSQSQGGS